MICTNSDFITQNKVEIGSHFAKFGQLMKNGAFLIKKEEKNRNWIHFILNYGKKYKKCFKNAIIELKIQKH